MSFSKELSFGLDIGDESVKVLQLRGGHTHATYSFGEAAIPKGAVSAGEIKDTSVLALSIKKAVKSARISAEHVIAALPETKTFLKLLHLPAHDATPIAARVAEELQKHIPYDLDDTVWDFTMVRQTDSELLVLAGVAPKTLANSYALAIRAAGLTPIELDLEPLAIARATIKDGPRGGCVLIADLGATKSTLILATGETVVHTADGKASGDALTATIAETLKIDGAEDMKKNQGLTEGSPEYRAILEVYAKNLSSRIAMIIGFPFSREFCSGVTEILLTGGGALLKGLPEYITASLKIPVHLGDPMVNTPARLKRGAPQESTVRYATAFGLALHALRHGHI